jgi:hypothetical protein
MKQLNVTEEIAHLGEIAKSYKILHFQSVYYYQVINMILAYTAIVIAPVSGILGAYNAVSGVQTPISITISIASFISGIILSVQKFAKFEERIASHRTIGLQYTALETNVRSYFISPPETRLRDYDYYTWLHKQMDDIGRNAPMFPTSVFTSFVRNARRSDFVIPDEYQTYIQWEPATKAQQANSIVNIEKIDTNPPATLVDVDLNEPLHPVVLRGTRMVHTTTFDEGQLDYQLQRLRNRLNE